MWKQLGGGVAAVVVLGGLWVAQCSGPRPAVQDVRLSEPTTDGGTYRVQAAIQNTWRGHGQVQVTIRLHDQASGHDVEVDKNVSLDPYERTLVVVDVPAPRANYTPQVEVTYPPR